jgi:hypothetical protein
LYYKEQWLEKKFVLNFISLLFVSCDFLLNVILFYHISSKGTLPIYLLGEVVDCLTRLGAGLHALYKWRQFIFKLQKLKDIEAQPEGGELQCCICLGNITKGK